MKNRNTLVVTAEARGRHSAVCGDVVVVPAQRTEIELVQALRRAGIDLDDYEHVSAAGNDYPYTWTWVRY